MDNVSLPKYLLVKSPMKKVRFESPIKVFTRRMDDLECHSPRPFVDKQETHRPDICVGYSKLLPYNPDPVLRYENSNCSPYPAMSRTSLEAYEPCWSPSNDLNLSMLDGSSHEPRKPIYSNQPVFFNHGGGNVSGKCSKMTTDAATTVSPPKVLSSIENTIFSKQPSKHIASNDFFIRRDNLNELNMENISPLHIQLNRLKLNRENVSLAKQAEMMTLTKDNVQNTEPKKISPETVIPDECRCHHCIKIIQNGPCYLPKPEARNLQNNAQTMNMYNVADQCECRSHPHHKSCHCINCAPANVPNFCDCKRKKYNSPVPQNAVDKKTWMLQKYEQNKEQSCMEVEKQKNVVKEKREPTVADLFKIIKLQNEQLQLLQEKVDKFISASNNKNKEAPLPMTNRVALESDGSEQHKISIGVMTSFEMVRTATVINKEYVTQTNDGAQIQCNRSQISIKEVVSEAQPGNLNFLDGIMPVGKGTPMQRFHCTELDNHKSNDSCDLMLQTENINDDKTLNELSLYNVHVDNATTPLLSPEQSLYLDVRDYSDSDSSSDNQSNVGWTYYNKVMTHVNGILQDSDMPSSASALYRNTHQRCVQMQIDKTNVSVTKRVKFGDDPLGVHQPHIYASSTDTSLKMNQLAAKYLARNAVSQPPVPVPKQTVMPIEMSFATRNYMERHRILQGGNVFPLQSPPVIAMPRFLDITALKQQPKFL